MLVNSIKSKFVFTSTQNKYCKKNQILVFFSYFMCTLCVDKYGSFIVNEKQANSENIYIFVMCTQQTISVPHQSFTHFMFCIS